ncbi:hypothetical protein FXB40_12505 [Bradyrhizobium rifense]|uniref:Uncharacterized protein n=1 Tax=Bradyrhizobium rifense TaxID=515499 RepID=A0A5D3KGW9_9BRAD|nr:hypothetical protein [Bradyrhizobium rifense]TYL96138.1 hypothetical protein FXB40_12505 [Bradyrhizobium rifense]
MKRFRFKPDKALGERLIKEARLAREKAEQLPPSPEQEALLKKANESDVAGRIAEWLNSSDLKPPT